MPAGRPKSYETDARLKSTVNRYFASISRTVTAMERVETGEKDCDGHKIFEQRPILNDKGKKITYLEYVLPPTVGGLCEFLGIHRSTWADYCNHETHPEFSDTTTHAQGRMRAWREEQLLTRKDVKGLIFDLQNNYEYSEKHEMELGPKAVRAVRQEGMSIAEKQVLLEEMKVLALEGGVSDEHEAVRTDD